MTFSIKEKKENSIMAVYVPRYNLLYVHIPKTGGTSIQQWMLESVRSAVAYKHLQHANLEDLRRELKLEDEFSFTTVRNPWARLVSSYFYEKKTVSERILFLKGNDSKKWNKKYGDIETWVKKSEELDKGLRYYIENNNTVKPQVDYVEGISLVVKIEEIDTKFSRIQKLCQCRKPVPVVNTTEHDHYTTYYDKKTKRVVEKMFQDDINYWGYTFD